ncbi:alkaline phosphatase [Thrips palmi]|uniref:Alkaline phosphatase n=1 Tax=Thrips palmi TaxID=161013 RepID=A0A6P8YPH3_THRPL|nr:alkaline phosphatase [Thrips palmi]XP_034238801.1 alkaline phosphatase [Thrips palmi]
MESRTVVVLLAALASAAAITEDAAHWRSVGKAELDAALRRQPVEGVAKNVVLFVGDGMGPSTVTAARIYGGGEASKLHFESLPWTGLLKTYGVDKKVPDSSCTATALFTGVKTNYEVAGLDANVKLADCTASLKEANQLSSLLQWAQQAGKATGFVTTTRVTHATPSALFSRCPDRRWECEANMPKGTEGCKDIGRQLVEEEPGKSLNVIMGGGRQCLQSNVVDSDADPIDTWSCRRKDNMDLIQAWKDDKESRKLKHKFVGNTGTLLAADTKEADYVLGVFANGHLKMEWNRDKSDEGMPSLKNMTTTAISILKRNPNGFVLVVEGGMIDMAHHRGHARQALDETLAMDHAVAAVLEMTDEKDTLVAITADHDQGMAFSGYAPREADILGIAENSKIDSIPYTSLLYTTGDASNYQYEIVDNKLRRKNPKDSDTTDFLYSQQTGVLTDEVHHSGSDVAIYARGPMAHLFTGVHEQNFVAFAIAYASKIGEYHTSTSGSEMIVVSQNVLLLTLTITLTYLYK